MITHREALKILRQAVQPLGSEPVALAAAFGRRLFRDIAADADFPPFDTTAMDGYAIRPGAAACRVRAGAVAAGDLPPAPLLAGESLRVMTGAPIPENTEAIIPVEESRQVGDVLEWSREPVPGAHIRRRGEIFRQGERLLRRGERLTPETILLCATVGADPVEVSCLPSAAVAATGSELVPAGRRPAPGQIRNSNAPALMAALARHGITRAVELPAVADSRDALERLFQHAHEFDIFITSGGVSAGDFDVCLPAAQAAGFEILFHRVAIKPGMPVALGCRGKTFWFGLPGNPVSALTTFELFVAPAIELFQGGDPQFPASARLAAPAAGKGGREEFQNARAMLDSSGELSIRPVAGKGSHDVAAAARRNALLALPPEGGEWEAGAILPALLLGGNV